MNEIRDRVEWIPSYSENRIGAMVDNRLEWTISRQRRWGSPITFLGAWTARRRGRQAFPRSRGKRRREGKEGKRRFLRKGKRDVPRARSERLVRRRVPPVLFSKKIFLFFFLFVFVLISTSASCPSCGGSNFEKLKDILDVWFDSGVSHAAVLRSGDYGLANPYTAQPPVPVMYLEGHDQHRGWFQSSLLTSVALTGRAPYDTVLTHGFVVAGDGRKMSKSLGNTIEPQDLLRTDGADVIRLWVASLDYTNDDPLSKEILQRTAEAYRKIRNTARFLLGNLFDFDPSKDAVPDARLEPLERWVLDAAARFAADARDAYARYEFHAVARGLLDFVTTDLSAFWCDVRKDAFYVLAADDPVRRSAQTAAWRLVETIALALSPICPFTAEEIFESLPGNAQDPSALFLKSWSDLALSEISSSEREAWGKVLALRASFLQSLEPLRRENKVGSASQAVAAIGRGEDVDRALALLYLSEEKLADVFGTPSIVREGGADTVLARPAEGAKCPRCWQVRRDVEPGEDGVCARCRAVVGG